MSRNALRCWGERVWPQRARNSCSCWRKTSATSSRGSISAADRHPWNDRWASVAARRTGCGEPAAVAATRADTLRLSGYRYAQAAPGWYVDRRRHRACGWRRHAGTGVDKPCEEYWLAFRHCGTDSVSKRDRAVDRDSVWKGIANWSACATENRRVSARAALGTERCRVELHPCLRAHAPPSACRRCHSLSDAVVRLRASLWHKASR